MPKRLRLKDVSASDGLTVGELEAQLAQYPDKRTPVVLRCGKNFRLGKILKSAATSGPILIGRRSVLK